MTTPPLSAFADIHTHGRTAPDAVTSVEPHEPLEGDYGAVWYSVGIHPWSTSEPVADEIWQSLALKARDPRVVAIGEVGLDKHRGGSLSCQEEIFRRQAALAEAVGKPLVIHCVGRYGRIMDLHRELAPSQLWVIHGFSGSAELARQLVAEGFGISLGHRAKPGVAETIPPDRLFRETDEG